MTAYEDNPKYMALVTQIRDAMVHAAEVSGQPLDAVACAADVAAEVLVSILEREQWEIGLDLLIGRLCNTLDRRSAAQAQ